MTRAASTRLQFTPDLSICRILNGMWQVSGAHGDIEPVGAIAEMFAYHDAGFTTWDLADHLHQVARFRENPLDHFEIAGVKREAKDTGVLSNMLGHAETRSDDDASHDRTVQNVADPNIGDSHPMLSAICFNTASSS